MTAKSAVTEMFDGISGSYDFLNHLLSLGIDRIWRRKTSRQVASWHPNAILDVATGTADLAIRLAKDNPQSSITGVDISTKMLSIGQQKIDKKHLGQRICLQVADALELPFPDNCFDAVTVAFGVRNFISLENGLREMARVCRPGGHLAVLEFSHPTNILMKAPYRWYSRQWIPRIGQRVSKHPDAYRYLPQSVEAFPSGEAFEAKLRETGIDHIHARSFSGGIATLYHGSVLKNNTSSQ